MPPRRKPLKRKPPYFRYYLRLLIALNVILPLAYGYHVIQQLYAAPLPQDFAMPLPAGGETFPVEWGGTRYWLAALFLGPFGLGLLWLMFSFLRDEKRLKRREKPVQYVIALLICSVSVLCLSLLVTAYPLSKRQGELLSYPAARELRLAEQGVVAPLSLIPGDIAPLWMKSDVKHRMYIGRLAAIYLPWQQMQSWRVVRQSGYKGSVSHYHEIRLKPEYATYAGLPETILLNRTFLRGREEAVLEIVKGHIPADRLQVTDGLLH